jgi:predicted dehydrogenase
MKNLRVAVVGCGFWSRFQVPAWRELSDVECVAVCDLDEVKAQRTAEAFGISHSYANAAEMIKDQRPDVLDVGSHLLDVVRFLFGEAKQLACQIQTIDPSIAGEDVGTVFLEMQNGMTVVCNLSFASRTETERFPETFILVEATKGSVQLGPDFSLRLTDADGTFAKRCPSPTYRWADPDYALVHASIVECHRNLRNGLLGEGLAETTGLDNLRTLELVFAAYESAQKGAIVAINWN